MSATRGIPERSRGEFCAGYMECSTEVAGDTLGRWRGKRGARAGRLLPVVVVDAEEGAGEGHHLAIGNEDAGVNFPRWGGDEGCAEECDAEEAEQAGDDELERRLGFIWLHGLRG